VQAAIWPQIAGQLAQTDVQDALSIAGSLTGNTRSSAMANVLSTWAQYDPGSAAAYALQMPNGQDQSNTLRSIASTWMQNDPTGAAQWLSTLPAGSLKDTAVQSAVYASMRADPADAMNLIAGISNAEKQQSLEQQVASNWMLSDRAAATAWVQSSNLPQKTKITILSQH
jgi:hypothetical protein